MKTSLLKLIVLTALAGSLSAKAAVEPVRVESEYNAVSGQTRSIPEAPTIVVGALLLLPFGASAIRILRRTRAENAARNG